MTASTEGKHGSSRKFTFILFFLIMAAAIPAVSHAASISFGPYRYYAA
ncbi:MAG TPA: hypothetical protein PLM53_18630 [Spirochaetota bacterium]|nr:hypothetical protein [Spirochaetota bacterium]HPC40651.1 hypothetical protein [Spirochaetota bacterium]HPL18628.1 hypothetical protein [Spirochaetota bacterium]HQF10238.1 hypothetical protein [Spirochaetota bacterium]HQH99116.1 hypothetical protein [Spirochaetota bacterium]